MKAYLKPLEGKYYKTVIVVECADGHMLMDVIPYIASDDFAPSDRELHQTGFTRAEYDSNALTDDGFGGKIGVKDLDIFSDHVEKQHVYLRAKEIVDRINSI